MQGGVVERSSEWRMDGRCEIGACLRLHIASGRPSGTVEWMAEAAKRMGLESSLRDRGRPRKTKQ